MLILAHLAGGTGPLKGKQQGPAGPARHCSRWIIRSQGFKCKMRVKGVGAWWPLLFLS